VNEHLSRPEDQGSARPSQIAQAYLMANEVIAMAVGIALLAGGGWWLDRRLGCEPLLILLGAGLGLVSAGFSLRRILRRIDGETEARRRGRTENRGTSVK
jgi:F0F1-type ATP synthase assembly protein I